MYSKITINNIRKLFRQELSEIYPQIETDSIANIVLESVLNLNKTEQFLHAENAIPEKEENAIRKILKRLKQNEPIQYILENTEFYGLSFYVNKSVLIPRQETEILVDKIISSEKADKLNIIDIGTGSGCIAISLKKNLPYAKVQAIDISEEALKVAEKNAKLNSTEIQFLHKNIFDDSGDFGMFDIIVSNPPYVRESEKQQMQNNVLQYEPHLALFVDNDNALIYYKAISSFAVKHLNRRGSIWVEINEAKAEQTMKVFARDGFSQIICYKDLNDKDRIIKASLL